MVDPITLFLGLPIGALTFGGVGIWYFLKRKHLDKKRIDKPLNISIKKIHNKNFSDLGIDPPLPRNYIVVPKGGLERNLYSVGKLVIQQTPMVSKSLKNFDTIVVDDVNDEESVKEGIYKRESKKIIPKKIYEKLPMSWREYLSWYLFKGDAPEEYENLIIYKEKELDISAHEKEAFSVITNPKKMMVYLEKLYPTGKTENFDFLKECVYKLALSEDIDEEIFNWILKNVKSKELIIVQVTLNLATYKYIAVIKKQNQVLCYNKVKEAFSTISILKDKLDQKKIEHDIYANNDLQFGTIIKRS